MFASENDLDEPQDKEFKSTITNSIRGVKEFDEDTKKQLKEIKEKELMENSAQVAPRKTEA